MFCKQCGGELLEGYSKCIFCGTEVDKEDQDCNTESGFSGWIKGITRIFKKKKADRPRPYEIPPGYKFDEEDKL